jgi:Branched-chain amino acid transport protein (AzlD)
VTAVWIVIAALSVGTIAIKASGPLTLRGRRPGGRALAVKSLMAPAVLAALVVYETFIGHPSGITSTRGSSGWEPPGRPRSPICRSSSSCSPRPARRR